MFTCIKFVCLCDLSQNAPVKCFEIFRQMCPQNAENAISESLILNIFRGGMPPGPLGVTKYEPPPRQNQNSTPMQSILT